MSWCQGHTLTHRTYITSTACTAYIDMQGSNTTHHDLITHAVSTNHHTKVGPYKRDVQHVRACMHDPMNTQGKHTRCSRCAYSECCATLVQCRLPTCFSGRYLWKSLALVQRLVAFPASYQASVQRLVISKDARCLLQHIPPMAKRIPSPAACFSSQCACPALPIFPMVGRNPFSRRLTRARPSVKL